MQLGARTSSVVAKAPGALERMPQRGERRRRGCGARRGRGRGDGAGARRAAGRARRRAPRRRRGEAPLEERDAAEAQQRHDEALRDHQRVEPDVRVVVEVHAVVHAAARSP